MVRKSGRGLSLCTPNGDGRQAQSSDLRSDRQSLALRDSWRPPKSVMSVDAKSAREAGGKNKAHGRKPWDRFRTLGQPRPAGAKDPSAQRRFSVAQSDLLAAGRTRCRRSWLPADTCRHGPHPYARFAGFGRGGGETTGDTNFHMASAAPEVSAFFRQETPFREWDWVYDGER